MPPYPQHKTVVLQVDPSNPGPEVRQAAEIVRAGGLVAFPTETVYGLGADATNEAAVRGIFEAKGRPASDPLIVHIASAKQLEAVAASVPEAAWRLAERFWPGPLTLILPRGNAIPAIVSSGRATVAVRVPRRPEALALIEESGAPIAAPSANLFSRPSPTRAEHVLEDLDGRIDMILDGGPTQIGVESTVLDLTCDPPELLRPGGVSLEELTAALGEVRYAPRIEENAASPGMLLKHYSPRAKLTLVSGGMDRVRAAAEARLAQGRRVGALLFDGDEAGLAGLSVQVRSLGPPDAPERAAERLFDELRSLDALGVDAILARVPGQRGLGLAVWDRLYRAAEGKTEGD